VLVLALDGVGWEAGATAFRPDLLAPLTSVFPSTSVSAWLSALTGRPVSGHGVPGVTFREPATGRLYNCFDDPGRPPAPAPATPGVFAELAARGVRCVVNQGELATWPAHWRGRLCAGAEVLPPAADWDRIRDDPPRTADAAITEFARAADVRPGPAGLLAWSWVNADDHVHRHGYTGVLRDALVRLDRAARAAADGGHTVLAFADHGLAPSRCPPELNRRWAALTGPGWCDPPPGGAGRVRWCYPRPGRAGALATRLRDLLGDDGLVVGPRRLSELGLLPADPDLGVAVGEVGCLAIGDRFPVPDPGLPYEHGSVSPAEMLVPLAVWLAR
jgi:hypothetical protein